MAKSVLLYTDPAQQKQDMQPAGCTCVLLYHVVVYLFLCVFCFIDSSTSWQHEQSRTHVAGTCRFCFASTKKQDMLDGQECPALAWSFQHVHVCPCAGGRSLRRARACDTKSNINTFACWRC